MKKAPEQFRISKQNAQAIRDKFNLQPQQMFKMISDESLGNNGMFMLPKKGEHKGYYYLCQISDGRGWEHVSISVIGQSRCPTWEEMCYVKDIFFNEDECVIQFHPAKSEYVNCHPYCLHLWRPVNEKIPVPEKIMVGI